MTYIVIAVAKDATKKDNSYPVTKGDAFGLVAQNLDVALF